MTPRGLVLGRRWDSDVVLEDGRASQVHALVLLTLNGPELLVLGKNATHVDGTERRGRLLLHDGAILEVPGGRFRVELVLGSEWASEGWWLETDSGRRYGLRALPFTVGGDTTDHLQLAGWPPVALRFFAARGAVAVEFGADGGALNDTVVPAGTTELPQNWDRITFGGDTEGGTSLVLRTGGASERPPTVMAGAQLGPVWVRFTFLPSGGRLEVDLADGAGVCALQLSELRARLLAALLAPKGGYSAGDAIPDDQLASAIWPNVPGRGRVDLNVLIHRTRGDLVRAGLNPASIVERTRRGGSTRFVLAPGAQVEVC